MPTHTTKANSMYQYSILWSIILVLLSGALYATDQKADIFIYKKYYDFYYNGGAFGKNYPLYPLCKHTAYREKIKMNASGEINGSCYSTACHRGYQGIWKIANNTLFLSALKEGCSRNEEVVDLKEAFGAEYTEHGLKAFWVTDTITLTDQPINISTVTRTLSSLTLMVQQGRIVKIIEEGPYFAPPPEYVEDKYQLASNQLPELMWYKGERFYAKGEWDPLSVILTDETYLNRMDTTEYGAAALSSCLSVDCYRSYQGIWEISNDTLYLKEVQDFCTEMPIFDLESVFGREQVTSKGIRAFWINQVLVVSSKEVSEFELKKERAPETYLKLKIVQGVIIKKELEPY